MLIVQVYVPCTNHSIDAFKHEIDILSDLCYTYSSYSSIVIMGDFNCQLTSNNNIINRRTRDTYASTLASSHNLKVVAPTSSGTVHTFYLYTGGDPTVIDHVLIDETTFYDVQNFTIKDDAPLNVSRHLPLLLTLRVNTNQSEYNATSHTGAFTRINYRWNTPRELRRYESAVSASFSHVKLRDTQDINARYNHIVKCLSSAAETTLPKRRYNKLLKPYWNTALKDLHENMRTLRHYWVADVKHTNHPSFRRYKDSKVSSGNVYARPPGNTSVTYVFSRK